MSSKIDERIVGMKFNGDQFQKGVADTSKSLEKLKRGLDLKGAGKGLSDLDAAGKNFSLANLANGVQDIASKFGALSIIGITALANIASKAVDVGLTMMRSLTVDPIKAGLDEYELKMGSIQTILSNTARYGTSLEQVTGSLDELNTYADKTIYNFGDMTKNIGLFTNAGLRVEDATSMIKGFSNEAAASGTNAQGAAGAAYQLSQALSAGTIRLMDWRSLQNVGMGNKNMQNGLIEVAGAMGMLNDETATAEEIQGDFNGSLEKNWLSADVMSTYLKIMAGDMDAAGMAAMGLSNDQIAMFQTQQKNAEEAATKVRTFTQLVGTMQESVGSGWAQTFDILIGDFNQATDLWTAVNDELGAMIDKQSTARNELLQGFVDAGGRDDLIAAFANIWQAVQMYIMPIQSAFKEIFPPVTVDTLKEISTWFLKLSENMKPSAETMKALKRIFMGVFAVLDIGWMILKGVFGLFGDLFGEMSKGTGGVLEFAAGIGDWLVKVRDAIKNGDGLAKTFEFIGKAIKKPIEWLTKLGEITVDFISVESWAEAWENLGEALRKVGDFFAPAVDWVKKAFKEVKKVVGDFFADLDPNTLIGSLGAGAAGAGIAGGGILAKLGIDKLIAFFKNNPLQGLGDTVKEVFGSVTDTFGAMQQKLKADTLKSIAIAIAIMTGALILLSFVDTAKLAISLGAMTVMFGQLSAMLIVMDKFMSKFKGGELAKLAGAMTVLAIAMLLLSIPILILGKMEWDELARGLIGLALGMGVLLNALSMMDGLHKKVIKIAPVLVTMSIAMLLLAAALKIMGSMEWNEIGAGLTVFAATLGGLVLAMQFMTKAAKGVPLMLAMAGALLIMSGALKVFGTMSWDEILRAMTVMAGAIAIMTGALMLLSIGGKFAPAGAAVMLAMAVALNILIAPLKAFGEMSWDEIIRSLVMLAGSLAILAGAMALMGIPIVLLGSVGILAASVALMMLAPALVLLGGMSWDEIGRGLTMLGATLAILAVGGLLMIPASVGFLLLGAAIMMIGTGAFLAGLGLTMFAAGILALAGAGAVGAEALKMAVMTMIGLIPMAMAAFAQGIIDFALVIATGGTEFTMAMTTLIMSLVQAIQTTAPAVIETIWMLVVMLVEKVVEGVPFFVDAGMRLITGVLDGIARNIGKLIDAGTRVVVQFLNGIARNIPIIIQAAINLVISFIEGLAQGIRANTARFIRAGNDLFKAIVDGVAQAIENGGHLMRWAGERIGSAIIEGAKGMLGINSPSKVFRDYIMGHVFGGVEAGGDKGMYRAERTGTAIGDAMIEATAKSISNMGAFASDIDLNPTIRPIVDLSDVKQKDLALNNMMANWTAPEGLDVSRSFNYAASIDAAKRADEEAYFYGDDDDPTDGPMVINYTQNNYSPKAISSAEVYRGTSNQLSQIRKGLPTNAGTSGSRN